MKSRLIASGFVADALACLSPAGLAPEPLLARLGLPLAAKRPLTEAEFGRLWMEIANVLEDEFFGLGARPMRPGSFALMCHATMGSDTLSTALRRAITFLDIVLDHPRGALSVRDGLAMIELSDPGPPRCAFAYRTYWLILMGLACWLVGRRIMPRQLRFACPAPRHREEYQSFFGAPVSFDSSATSLIFDAAYLRLPVIRDGTALRRFLRGAPGNILFRYREDSSVAGRVRKRLADLPPANWPDFLGLARDMQMSPATLRRRLRTAGQGFAAIKDERRAILAQQLLRNTTKPIAEIAADLGFSEPSAFYRAFRKWHGQSPTTLRLRQCGA